MNKEEITRMKRGLMCCIEANQTHHCPPDCPYADSVVRGVPTYCEGVLLLDIKEYITRLERMARPTDQEGTA